MALRVTNAATQAILIENGKVADTGWSRLVGLMGKPELPEGDGLLLSPSNSIHTSFMRFPIDVIYVSKDHKVVDVDEAVPPWQVRKPRWQARSVIELPAGTIARTGTAVGHELIIEK